MLRFSKRITSGLAWVGMILLGIGGILWIRALLSIDPFARLRQPASIGSDVGIRLEDVQLRHYKGTQLRTSAKVARLDVRQDRMYLDLAGISDGVYYAPKGSFKFAADRADWNAVTRKIEVTSGAHVQNKDLDLTVTQFSVDQDQAALRVPGRLVGRLYDGNVEAMNLTYRLDNGNYSVGPASWEGLLAVPTQDGEKNPKRARWKIKSEGLINHEGDIEKWPDGEATDGEVLVKADMVERNTKTDVITATGKVRYFSQKTNMTCEKAVIFHKEKRAVFTGNVHMLFKPEDQQDKPLMVEEIPPFRPAVPDEISKERPPAPAVTDQDNKLDEQIRSTESLKKYPVTAMSEKVEYWYARGNRHGIITGNPQARQELPGNRWRHIWTPKGLYDGEKETLRMVSSAGKKDTRVKTSLGDDLVCEWFQISTKDGDDAWSGKGVMGDVYPDEEEVPKTTSPKKESPKPATQTPPAQPGTPATQPAATPKSPPKGI